MNAPESELPPLTEQQKDVARRMGIPEQEYARGVLVSKYGEERQKERGKKLGQQIDDLLLNLGPSDYQLQALVREGAKSRWVARIITPKEMKNVAIPFEIADDVVDSAAIQDIERLKQLILKAVEREDMINPNALT